MCSEIRIQQISLHEGSFSFYVILYFMFEPCVYISQIDSPAFKSMLLNSVLRKIQEAYIKFKNDCIHPDNGTLFNAEKIVIKPWKDMEEP